MKLTTTRDELLAAFQRAHVAVADTTPLPVLRNFLLDLKGQIFTVAATDLSFRVQVTLPVQGAEDGATTVDASTLLAIVRQTRPGPLEIESTDGTSVVIRSGDAVFRINAISADDFPSVPKWEDKKGIPIKRALIREMIQRTVYAAAKEEEGRQVLTGLCFQIHGTTLTVVGTDGRRLAMVEQELEGVKGEAELIVPADIAADLPSLLDGEGMAAIIPMEGQMVIDAGDLVAIAKLLEGKYPNVRQVIPTQSSYKARIGREALLGALRRVSLFSIEKTYGVKFSFSPGTLELSAENPKSGEARERLSVEFDGKPVSLHFNAEFLMEPLKALVSDQVTLEMTDEMTPAVLRAEEPFVYVIMPLRIA